jgi:EAL domain-containing protein (putative c-di-GMP-specific phosphodiesterase class I)
MGQGSLNAICSAPQEGANVASRFSRYQSENRKPALSIHILNMEQIGLGFGAGAAQAASDHVRSIIKFELRGRDQAGLAEYVLRRLSEHPVTYDGQRFHLNVSLAPTSDTGGCAIKASTVYGNPAFPDDAWCRCPRADMALAVTLFEAMANGELALAWQPVRDVRDPASILYHECLLRRIDPQCDNAENAIVPMGDAIMALERLGLIRALDRYVMAKAIDELRIGPARMLGVNLSAASLVDDYWWTEILAELETSPSLARRLTVEITETAQPVSVAEAAKFISHLRRLGCRIALDDFGTGHASIQSLLSYAPDRVKIDKYFVSRARASLDGRRALSHLIGLAEALGAEVIVEGVETAADAILVREAGGQWQQGYHHGRPTVGRPWRMEVNAADSIRIWPPARGSLFHHKATEVLERNSPLVEIEPMRANIEPYCRNSAAHGQIFAE